MRKPRRIPGIFKSAYAWPRKKIRVLRAKQRINDLNYGMNSCREEIADYRRLRAIARARRRARGIKERSPAELAAIERIMYFSKEAREIRAMLRDKTAELSALRGKTRKKQS